MALVDFYQLVALYKPRRSDAGFPTTRSRPFMSVCTPPPSPSPSVEPDEARLSPPPSVQPQLETLKRKPSAHSGLSKTTPLARGAAMRQKQEGDTDRVERYNCSDYEPYITEDLKGRVFVDFEVFIKHVLRVPDKWRDLWGPTIEAVKADPEFDKHHKEYCGHCNKSGSREVLFYQPLVDTANAVLEVLSRSGFADISSGVPQRYRVNDPKKLRGGVMNKANLSPDVIVLDSDCQPSQGGRLHWANALYILEVKPYDNAVYNGRDIRRLVTNGIDPIQNHALPPETLRFVKKSTPLATSTVVSASTSGSTRKQPANGSSAANQPAKKRSKAGPTLSRGLPSGGASTQVGGSGEGTSTPKPETDHEAMPAVQVCRYLLEIFSVPLLRSHATVGLVNRDHLQLYHANCSVILVSSAINFSEGEGLEKFIAVIIAFRRLSLKENGILDNVVKESPVLVKNPKIHKKDKKVQDGSRLVFPKDKSQDEFTAILGEVISRGPAVIGRSTVVLGVKSERWPGIELVIKVSWPGSGRVPESKFVKKAMEEVEKTSGKWAAKHLPRILYSKDIPFTEDSVLKSVEGMFKKAKFVNGCYSYEPCALRIIIQERLYPLKLLTNARDIGQVFLDTACTHRWLYDYPGILHRDLSLNNIMWCLIEEINAKGEREKKIYGVLTDYDLSSWKEDLKKDYQSTSQQRTGTPPYMAQEILQGTSTTHLYRHDIESLFYVMLLVMARHTIIPTEGGPGAKTEFQVVMREDKKSLPYQKWFNMRDYDTLGYTKESFFSGMQDIKLSPVFEDFRPWLTDLQHYFSEGFSAKNAHSRRQKHSERIFRATGGVASTPDPFDDETLGGNITYSTVIDPTHYLRGELEGLIVRYGASDSE